MNATISRARKAVYSFLIPTAGRRSVNRFTPQKKISSSASNIAERCRRAPPLKNSYKMRFANKLVAPS